MGEIENGLRVTSSRVEVYRSRPIANMGSADACRPDVAMIAIASSTGFVNFVLIIVTLSSVLFDIGIADICFVLSAAGPE